MSPQREEAGSRVKTARYLPSHHPPNPMPPPVWDDSFSHVKHEETEGEPVCPKLFSVSPAARPGTQLGDHVRPVSLCYLVLGPSPEDSYGAGMGCSRPMAGVWEIGRMFAQIPGLC